MTEMDLARLQDRADTYGGDIARWPAADQQAARALLACEPAAGAVLDAARGWDELLDDWRVEPADMALRTRILAAERTRRRLPALAPLRLWFAGAGLAAALAGVSCGVFLSSAAVREARDEAAIAAAFRDPTAAIAPFSEPVQSL